MHLKTGYLVSGIAQVLRKVSERIERCDEYQSELERPEPNLEKKLAELRNCLSMLDFVREELAFEILDRNPDDQGPADPDEFLMYQVEPDLSDLYSLTGHDDEL